jgi:hypothetical protein
MTLKILSFSFIPIIGIKIVTILRYGNLYYNSIMTYWEHLQKIINYCKKDITYLMYFYYNKIKIFEDSIKLSTNYPHGKNKILIKYLNLSFVIFILIFQYVLFFGLNFLLKFPIYLNHFYASYTQVIHNYSTI